MEDVILRAEVSDAQQLEQALLNDDFQYIYAPMELLSEATEDKFRLIVVPPVYLGDCEEAVRKKLIHLKKVGFERLLCHTAAHLELSNELGFKAHGGFRMNITNSLSQKHYENSGLCDSTLSIELTVSQLSAIVCTVPRGIIAYGKLPLMITARCPINNGKPCGKEKKCGGKITDRKGNELSVICSNTVEILNPDTLVLSDKLDDFSGFDFLTLKFTDEADVNAVARMYLTNAKPQGKLTRGLYYRGTE